MDFPHYQLDYQMHELMLHFQIGLDMLNHLVKTYLLYLGYKIIGSFSAIKEDNSRPLKFYEAALFQIVNPKAWTISSMVASGFLPKDDKRLQKCPFRKCITSQKMQ